MGNVNTRDKNRIDIDKQCTKIAYRCSDDLVFFTFRHERVKSRGRSSTLTIFIKREKTRFSQNASAFIDRKLYERQFHRRYDRQSIATPSAYLGICKRGSPFPVPDNCAPHLCKPVNHPVASPRRRRRSKSPLLSITLRPSYTTSSERRRLSRSVGPLLRRLAIISRLSTETGGRR